MCLYACHRALESSGDRRLRADRGTDRRTDASDFYILDIWRCHLPVRKMATQIQLHGRPASVVMCEENILAIGRLEDARWEKGTRKGFIGKERKGRRKGSGEGSEEKMRDK